MGSKARLNEGISFSTRLIRAWESLWDILLDRLGRLLRSRGSVANQTDHKRASGYLEHGRRYYNDKRYKKAEQLFRKATIKDPAYSLAFYYLGLSLYRRDQSDDALSAWQSATKVQPESEAAMKAHKKIEYVRKNMERVINDLEDQIRHG